MRSVTVRAGMRLHLGFYRFSDPPFEYGALGLAIEEPSLSVTLSEGASTSVEGWVASLVSRVLNEIGMPDDVGVGVEGFVIRHVGLGTTTRLVLSLIKAAYLMRGEVVDLPTMAWRLGRGRVSGVGVWSFLYGGMIVDSGKVPGMKAVPPPIMQAYLPTEWRAVVALPLVSGYSVTEEGEEPIMREPLGHPKQDVLYSALGRLASAARLGVFNEFVSAVEKIQELTGEYFSRWQGGIYCCEQSESLAKKMITEGLRGVGQSSWGPTVYGFADSAERAERAGEALATYMNEAGIRGYVWVTRVARSGHTARVLNR